jgi:hemerythrin-like domain-containing protein
MAVSTRASPGRASSVEGGARALVPAAGAAPLLALCCAQVNAGTQAAVNMTAASKRCFSKVIGLAKVAPRRDVSTSVTGEDRASIDPRMVHLSHAHAHALARDLRSSQAVRTTIHQHKETQMAGSKRGASGTLPVALEMLIADHRKVSMMFDQYEDEKEDSGEDQKRELAQRICMELKVHTQVEEELFYPWARENLEEEDLIEEATVEHQSAKDLIAQIEGAGEIDETFDAKVKVLGEYIKHHVNEEENEMFPQLRGEQEALDELGQEMTARKVELMEEMGMEMTDEESAMAQQRGRSKQQSSQRNA